jgi:hemolysin activation/secretion protein
MAQAPPRPPSPAQAGASAPELNPAARLPHPPPPHDQDIFSPEPPGPCPLADSSVQVTLTSVTLRGSTAVAAKDFAAGYAEYIGKPQPVSVICAIRDRAARTLFDKGVLARVEIPEQRISGGALILDVIEAHVVNVRVRGDIGPAQAAVERYVEKLRGMRPFDMRKAQRYLLLASDIPGVRVRAAIRPSSTPERGAVDIDVSVTREAFSLVGSVQNLGSKTVGPWGALVRADAQSFTAYGENSTLVGFRTVDSNEQWVVQATEEARFGGDGLIGRLSAVYGQSHPGDVLKPLALKSESMVLGTEAAYPLLRTRRKNVNVASGFELIDQKTDVAGSAFSQDKLRVLYARLDGDLRTWVADRPVQFTGSVTLRKGIAGLGASPAGSPLLTRGFGKPDAWVLRGSGAAEVLLTGKLTASLQVQAQYASQPLFAYEQMALGDLGVGRGYDPAAALGDKGVAGAFELRYAAMQLHPKVRVSPFLFYDVGGVRNNNAAASGLQPSHTLHSVGAGLNFRIDNRANLALTYAHPLDAVGPGLPRANSRLLVRLTASFL